MPPGSSSWAALSVARDCDAPMDDRYEVAVAAGALRPESEGIIRGYGVSRG